MSNKRPADCIINNRSNKRRRIDDIDNRIIKDLLFPEEDEKIINSILEYIKYTNKIHSLKNIKPYKIRKN